MFFIKYSDIPQEVINACITYTAVIYSECSLAAETVADVNHSVNKKLMRA